MVKLTREVFDALYLTWWVWCYAMPCTKMTYGSMQYPVLRQRMVLYDTAIAYGYATPRTDTAYCAIPLPGTDLAYGAANRVRHAGEEALHAAASRSADLRLRLT
eukprot:2947358-Rhodomonas_salina.1